MNVPFAIIKFYFTKAQTYTLVTYFDCNYLIRKVLEIYGACINEINRFK